MPCSGHAVAGIQYGFYFTRVNISGEMFANKVRHPDASGINREISRCMSGLLHTLSQHATCVVRHTMIVTNMSLPTFVATTTVSAPRLVLDNHALQLRQT